MKYAKPIPAVVVLLGFFLLCTLPENPDNPDNASGLLQLYSPVSGISDSLVSDSVGSIIDINVSFKLVHYIDSVIIKIVSDNSSAAKQVTDTIIIIRNVSDTSAIRHTFKITLTSAGTKTVTLTTHKSNGTVSVVHGTLIVYPRKTEKKNAPPVFQADSPSAYYIFKGGDLLSIPVIAIDPDADSVSYLFSLNEPGLPRPATATLQSGRFVWQSTLEDKGIFQIVFKALDQTDSASVQVTVVIGDTSGNSAPKIVSTPTLVVIEGKQWQYKPVAVSLKDTNFVWSLRGKNALRMDFDSLTGTISWIPDRGIRSSDSLTLIVRSRKTPALPDSQMFVVSVVADIDTPVAIGQSVTTSGTRPIIITLSAQDETDSIFTFTITASPAKGAIDKTNPPVITYTPAKNASGVDTIEFTATNRGGITSKPAKILITISSTPLVPPVAHPLSLNLPEDDSLIITLSGTDADSSRNLVYSVVKTTAQGTLSVINGKSVTFRPPRNFSGADSFSYRVYNGEAYSDPANVTLTVTAVNDTPAFSDQALSTGLNTQLKLTLKGSDIEDSVLTFRIVKGPASGNLDTSALPAVTYTPSANFKGNDTLHCRAIDSDGLQSPVGLVTIAVASDNQKPAGTPLSITIAEDDDTTITLAGSDIETPAGQLTFRIYKQPSSGTLGEISGAKVTYTPNANFGGQDTFYYMVNDGTVDSDSCRVALRITPVNDIPVSAGDLYSANEDQILTVTSANGVLANDTDPERDALTAELVDPVATEKGSVLLNTDGSFIFTPASNSNGTTTFTYRAKDDKGGIGVKATVTIATAALNDPPIFSGLAAVSVNEGDSVILETVATDPDQTTPTLSITSGTQSWITVSSIAGNRISLKIKPVFSVVQSGTQAVFKLYFRATDGQTPVDDSLSITVVNVNQKPSVSLSLAKQSDTVAVGTSLSITVTAADNDGTIAGVKLYHNNTPLTDNTAPYQFTISNLAYASHTFRAVAIDNSNDSATTAVYTVKAGRWRTRVFTSSDEYMFDNGGVPARSSFNEYSDRLVIDVGRYNMVSETWASSGALIIDTATLNSYHSRDNGIYRSLTFTQNNLPVLLLYFTKNVLDANGDLTAFDFSFLIYSQASGGTWSRTGSVVRKLNMAPITSFSYNITVSSAGTIAFCLNQHEMRSNVNSTTYIQNGSNWTTVTNPVLYTDITYLNTTLYSHCGSYIYENPVKVYSLSGTTWTPVGGDGTVAATNSQRNILTRGSDGTLYIAIPDKGVFINDNSATWRRLWPTDNAGPDTSDITVSIVGNTPHITYVVNTDYSLYCKRILNGTPGGILDASGLVATLTSGYNSVSVFSSQRAIMLKIGSDQLNIYRLDIPE